MRYLDRSDTFDDAKVERQVAGRKEGDHERSAIKQQYFLFGTDNTGRDLLSRTLMARPHLAGDRAARRRHRGRDWRVSTARQRAFSAAGPTRS